MIKDFQCFIDDGIVRKTSPDAERAKSLVKESERKMRVLERQVTTLGIDEEIANEYVLLCYDAIMFLVRAKMLLRGYHASGLGAHEAEVSFMRLLGFDEKSVQFADQMRYFRNGMLYYGARLDRAYAEKVIQFTKDIYSRLKA